MAAEGPRNNSRHVTIKEMGNALEWLLGSSVAVVVRHGGELCHRLGARLHVNQPERPLIRTCRCTKPPLVPIWSDAGVTARTACANVLPRAPSRDAGPRGPAGEPRAAPGRRR